MGFKDLQVLILLVWLCLGHTWGQPTDSILTESQWKVSPAEPLHRILQSRNRLFFFDLMWTDMSKDSCAAVVRHASNTTVWVANFNSQNSNFVQECSLKFTNATGLVLTDSSGKEIWKTDLTKTDLTKTYNNLNLDNNGDLSLRDSNNLIAWNSFGYPGDTLIKLQRLEPSVAMKAAQLNQMYSAGGIFFMEIKGPNLTLHEAVNVSGKVGSNIYKSFQVLHENRTQDIEYVQVRDGLVAFFGNNGTVSFSTGNSKWDYARLESDGGLVLKTYFGSNRTQLVGTDLDCALPAACGSFGICSPGRKCTCPPGFRNSISKTNQSTCERLERLPFPNCTATELVKITGLTYWSASSPGGESMDRDLCEARCHTDCNCSIALHVAANGADPEKCFLKLDSMHTIRLSEGANGNTHTLFLKIPLVPLTPPPSPDLSPSSRRTAASAFAGGAGAFVLLLLGVSAWWLVLKRRKIFDDADRGVYDAAVAAAGKPPQQQLPPRYKYEELGVSTSGFKHVFGSHGQSSVYFGTLPNNSDTKIAVKALDDRGHKDKDFLAVVATMGRLSHPNLVPLLGYCKEGKHKMLVYELVNEGKSLSWLLFDAGAPTLDASTRRLIALGMAQGLQHLDHNGVMHGGVKPENILIDTHRQPKLVDYGLLDLWNTRFAALRFADLRGASGYMAPESLQEGPLTAKADVYSLGVVILELVSGRRCLIPEAVPEERRYLPAWGFAVLQRHYNDLDSALELADPRLNAKALSEIDQQVLKGMACVALCCVQADPALRPSMDEVVLMLNSELTVNVPPSSPALDDYADKLCAATQQQGFIHSPSLSENSDMRFR